MNAAVKEDGTKPLLANQNFLETNSEILNISTAAERTEMRKEATQNVSSQQMSPTPMADASSIGIRTTNEVAGNNILTQNNQVTGAKVINQIVKAAKVQLTEGRADMALRLDPPHLGTVNMNVSVVQGAVTATIETSSVTAKHVLEANLSALKQALTDAGVQVEKINVSVGSNLDQAFNPFENGHGMPNHQGRSDSGLWQSHAMQGLEIGGPELDLVGAAAHSVGIGSLNYLA
jgi:flagellar hook-length control protein FliK